ncbi:MAG: hypothetical protein A07HR67_00837 [uncultured archaeon A07HR67]|nr:MAG: hypothetical protein A07HR67_00837 [uncultured archaeon A07HR67]
MDDITITTTDGRELTEYVGVVSGEAVIGANAISDIAAGVRDVGGGRSGSSETRSRQDETRPSGATDAAVWPTASTPGAEGVPDRPF